MPAAGGGDGAAHLEDSRGDAASGCKHAHEAARAARAAEQCLRRAGKSNVSQPAGQCQYARMSASQYVRTRTAQEEVQSRLATADRLLRGLESCRGAFANTVTGWLGADHDGGGVAPANQVRGRAKRAGAAGGKADRGGSPNAAVEAPLQSAVAEEQRDPIAQALAELKAQADALNVELRAQASE